MYEVNSFLEQVYKINKHYEEIAKLSGENFNIFQILGLSSDELSHSSFIATLLNPKGNHEQGELFLELFLEEINIKNFSARNSKIETEKFIGRIDPNFENGGRIDIVISEANSDKQIYIENKIYADDQEKQLFRYSKNNKYAELIYLTLYGNDASKASLGELKPEDYIRISYSENILNWLEKCKKESVEYPLLRETISQYIYLIKRLTGQSRSKLMENEILELLLKDSKNIDSAFIISENINKLKKQIIETKLLHYLKTIYEKEPYNMTLDIKNNNILSAYWGFSFEKEEWKYLKIRFEFEKNDLKDLIYGFCRKNSKTVLPKEIEEKLKTYNGISNSSWPLYKYVDKYRNWNKDVFVALVDYKNSQSNDVVNTINEKIEELLNIIKDIEL